MHDTLGYREARREFGDEIANKLKLDKDGRTILWPQPDNHPEDPQNVGSLRSDLHYANFSKISANVGLCLSKWSERKKMTMLLIIS